MNIFFCSDLYTPLESVNQDNSVIIDEKINLKAQKKFEEWKKNVQTTTVEEKFEKMKEEYTTTMADQKFQQWRKEYEENAKPQDEFKYGSSYHTRKYKSKFNFKN